MQKEMRRVHEDAFKKKVNIFIQLTRLTTEKWLINYMEIIFIKRKSKNAIRNPKGKER